MALKPPPQGPQGPTRLQLRMTVPWAFLTSCLSSPGTRGLCDIEGVNPSQVQPPLLLLTQTTCGHPRQLAQCLPWTAWPASPTPQADVLETADGVFPLEAGDVAS